MLQHNTDSFALEFHCQQNEVDLIFDGVFQALLSLVEGASFLVDLDISSSLGLVRRGGTIIYFRCSLSALGRGGLEGSRSRRITIVGNY